VHGASRSIQCAVAASDNDHVHGGAELENDGVKVLFAIAARIDGFDAVISESVLRAIQTRLSVPALIVDDEKSPSLNIFDNQ
jgi:hypothetical protein